MVATVRKEAEIKWEIFRGENGDCTLVWHGANKERPPILQIEGLGTRFDAVMFIAVYMTLTSAMKSATPIDMLSLIGNVFSKGKPS